MYDSESVGDIQEALKALLGGTVQYMLETERENHLGYELYEKQMIIKPEMDIKQENQIILWRVRNISTGGCRI
ncbi:MAG: hypothetical protein WAO56_11360 [Miniphocaeibacter sp.]|uniref:hypothetical protein n=1 Tax=Miniphocaeibacter sp. TaxID=3100973 RepID=UPI0018048F38|nr:hypothetical protein [Gallicola sp.]